MSAIAFLLIVLLLSGIGSAVLVLRNRRPTSVESGIDDFRREMNALAPPEPPSLPPRMPDLNADRDELGGRPHEPERPDGSADPGVEASEPEPLVESEIDDDRSPPSPADPRPEGRESAKLRSPDDPGTP